MGRLSNDAFLAGLDKHFSNVRKAGSLFITFKRYVPTPGKFGVPKTDKAEPMCLVRAKLGSKAISTLVHEKDVTRFQGSLGTTMKGNMDGLKQVEKKKKERKAKP